MTLVSHTHRFVYLKTFKTASTSIEAFFERYCVDDPARHQPVEYCPEIVTSAGVIGCRRGKAEKQAATWHAHMAAWDVMRRMGIARWLRSFRFTSVRNPFEQMVARFVYFHRKNESLLRAPLPERREAFSDWYAARRAKSDRYIYTIAGLPVVHDVIRYETLQDDVARIARRLGLPDDAARLPRFKSQWFKPPEPYSAYYDDDMRAKVGHDHRHALARFGYRFEEREPVHATA
ncbi:sulfotransferase family 2 domain-containing protein [Halovulum sp. GXIMD14794]